MAANKIKTDIEIIIAQIASDYIFEFNDDKTRNSITKELDYDLSNYKTAKNDKLYEYKILCNEINNTARFIDEHSLSVIVFFKEENSNEWDIAQTILGYGSPIIATNYGLIEKMIILNDAK